jgi:bacterioferritin
MTTTTKQIAAVASIADVRNSSKPRRMARTQPAPAAVTETFRGDREAALRLLNEALATELVCVLRYRRHHFMARGLGATRSAEEFLLHADEELAHADLIAERIVQLGGEPDFAPGPLRDRCHADGMPARTIVEMLRENLAAARIAIDSYGGLIESLGESDRTTRRMLEGILGVQAAHADELLELLAEHEAK